MLKGTLSYKDLASKQRHLCISDIMNPNQIIRTRLPKFQFWAIIHDATHTSMIIACSPPSRHRPGSNEKWCFNMISSKSLCKKNINLEAFGLINRIKSSALIDHLCNCRIFADLLVKIIMIFVRISMIFY